MGPLALTSHAEQQHPMSLVVAEARGQLVARDALMGQLRQEREEHHHTQIWTKEPHGGRHVKVGAQRGSHLGVRTARPGPGPTTSHAHARHASQVASKADPQSERSLVLGSSSCCPEDLLGYERIQSGATTNLVGNHMTRGAVDLVAAELVGLADGLHDDPARQQAVDKQRQARREAACLPERARAGPPMAQAPSEPYSQGDRQGEQQQQQQQQVVGPCLPSGPPDMSELRRMARALLQCRADRC